MSEPCVPTPGSVGGQRADVEELNQHSDTSERTAVVCDVPQSVRPASSSAPPATTLFRITYKQRLSAAAAAIEGIPEQLDDVMQTKANNLAWSVEAELASMRKVISRSAESEAASADKAVESLA